MSRRLVYGIIAIALAVLLMLTVFGPRRRPNFWLTADQRADHLMRSQNYSDAARTYTDPLRQGIAWYRAGDFKSAAAAFSRVTTPEGTYDHANALVMLGKYDAAVKAYDRALIMRPGWKAAEVNRAIAVVRRDRLKKSGGDEVGGQLKPDEIVYEKGAKKSDEAVQVDEGPPLSDVDLQAMWLRRVQTKPADFLRAKFAFQSSRQTSGGTPK